MKYRQVRTTEYHCNLAVMGLFQVHRDYETLSRVECTSGYYLSPLVL